MADSKITALGSIGTGTDPANDQLVIVDVSDVLPTGMATTGTTKRVGLNQLLSSSPTATGAFSVTGLVTAGSAVVTGDLTVDTSTLKVDSTNNRVGINNASPAVSFDAVVGAGGFAAFRSTSYSNVLVNGTSASAATGGSQVQFTTTGNRDWVIGQRTDTAYAASNAFFIRDDTATTTRFSINTNGAIVLSGGTTTASGVGIAFPNAQSASSDANCLDDYEEGVWSGTLKGSTTDPTAVTATGRYTKIGRNVYVEIAFNGFSNVGAVGSISITGLPFAAAAQNIGSLMMSLAGTFTNGSLSSFISASASTIETYVSTSNAAVAGVQHNAGTGRSLWACINYTF